MSDITQRKYFSQASLWADEGVASQHDVAHDVVGLIPPDVATILDVGCGSGIVTNKLYRDYDVVGCDTSIPALAFVKPPRVAADIQFLPFQNYSFDLVLATDVIEHVPANVYPQVLSELKRIARRYLLVAVPYEEILDAALVDCPSCGATFHAHHHQRTYANDTFGELFAPEFALRNRLLSGSRWIYGERRLVEAKRAVSGLDYDFPDAICPKCNLRRGTVRPSSSALAIGRRFNAFQAMNALHGHLNIPPYSELIGLFDREAKDDFRAGNDELRQANPKTLSTELLKVAADPQNYPDEGFLIEDRADSMLISLPVAPVNVAINRGSAAAIEIFDSIAEKYVAARRLADSPFELPRVAHDARGALIRLIHPIRPINIGLNYSPLSSDEIAALTFGLSETVPSESMQLANQTIAAQDERITSLLAQCELLESRRATAEELAASINSNIAAQEQRITSLLAHCELLESKRATAEQFFESTLININGEIDVRNETIASQDRHINVLLEQCELIEARRIAAEGIARSSHDQVVKLQDDFAKKLRVKELEEQNLKVINSTLDLENRAQSIVNPTLASIRHFKLRHPLKSILVLSHMYPRDYHPAGGGFVHEQVKALRGVGYDVRVLSGEPHWINTLNPAKIFRGFRGALVKPVWNEFEGVPVLKFPYVVSNALPFQTHAFTYSKGLKRVIAAVKRDFDFELVHAHTSYTDGTAGAIIADTYRVPLVLTEHTGPFSTLTRTPFLRRATTRALQRADTVITVSKTLGDDVKRELSLDAYHPILVIPNVVDTNLFRPLPPRSQDNLLRAIWVGHFVEVKRVPDLLRAFQKARLSEPRLRLRLVGTGEGELEVRSIVAQCGLAEHVEFAGHVKTSDLPREYANADFLVISSRTETFGVVAIEAMSCGKPVLTTNCGGPAEIVTDPALGIISSGFGVDEFCDSILQICHRLPTFDANLIRRVTEIRFSRPAFLAKVLEAYQSASNTAAGRTRR